MFGRKKKAEEQRNAIEMVANFVDYQVETERMKDAARTSERPVAILKPQIPIGSGNSAGWFGGNAELPEGTAWPEQDGHKLLFVGQVDLAALPRDIWSGIGPRNGWLGIFLPGHGEFKPKVLHFDGPLVETNGPPPNSAGWTRSFNFDAPQTFALPRWPIVVENRSGDELHQANSAVPADEQLQSTVLDPAYHPFDRDTMSLLFETLGESVTHMAREIVRFPAMKKLRSEDAAWFERMRPIILETFVRFFEIEGRMRTKREFTESETAAFVADLAQLDAYDCHYLKNDDDGYCELVLREAKLLEWQPDRSDLRRWWHRYDSGLTNHALKAYTTDPDLLPPALSSRVQSEWQRQTSDGFGAMGHAPLGHIYTPHGPDSPNEVLLELHTSQLTGWIWGDCYSLVLLIDRKALQRGDFSSIMFDITN